MLVLAVAALVRGMPLAAGSARCGIGMDLGSVDGLWEESARISGDVRIGFPDGFGIRLPVAYLWRTQGAAVSAFSIGASLEYYPFGEGFFVLLGMAQMVRFFGPDRPEDEQVCLQEVAVGWTWRPCGWLFVEPALRIADPGGVFASERALFDETMGKRPQFQASCMVGVSLPVPDFRRAGSLSPGNPDGSEEY